MTTENTNKLARIVRKANNALPTNSDDAYAYALHKNLVLHLIGQLRGIDRDGIA